MAPREIKNKIHFNSGDVEALICALPLVALAEADTPSQTQLNVFCSETAAQKLAARITVFTADELRVTDAAIGFAIDIIKGTGNEFISIYDVDPDWKAELSKNVFVYARLKPAFDDLIDCFFENQ